MSEPAAAYIESMARERIARANEWIETKLPIPFPENVASLDLTFHYDDGSTLVIETQVKVENKHA